MTSIPASRRERATTFTPRSWPSRPTLARRTRMFSPAIPEFRIRYAKSPGQLVANQLNRRTNSMSGAEHLRRIRSRPRMPSRISFRIRYAAGVGEPHPGADPHRADLRVDPQRHLRGPTRARRAAHPGAVGQPAARLAPARGPGTVDPEGAGLRTRRTAPGGCRRADRTRLLPSHLRAPPGDRSLGGEARR